MKIMSLSRLHFYAIFASFFTLGSCSKQLTSFTSDIYQNHNWSDDELKKVQFYLSDDLVIYRTVEDEGSVKITKGEIKMVDGKKTEQIRFKSGTPGVFISRPKEDHFAVSFESGDDARYLMFGPNPKFGGKYMLMASEWNRRTGKVNYAGEKFYTSSDDIPRLLVSMKYKKYRKTQSREAKGRTVNQP